MLLIIRQRPLNKRASHMLSFNYFTRVFNKIKMHQDFDKSSDVEVGSIKSLTLSNFMCHEYFEIEFGPRVNFIVGKNGSGKSAILSAIVLVLGGRASITNRGQSIKSFIKSGESRAKVTLKLCNFNGCDKTNSYKYDQYGDSIIVERIIKSEGGGYVLKSSSQKIISTKKEDLDEIIKHFNIQIDNPVCVLNQEVSRNFLNSKNPKDKYNFFMKATQLEQIRNDYALAKAKHQLTILDLESKKVILKEVKTELKELKNKVDMYNKLANQGNNLIILNNELKWSKVIEKETEIEKSLNEMNEKAKKLKSIEKNIEELSNQLNNLDLEKIENLKKLEEITRSLNENAEKRRTLANQLKDLKNKKLTFNHELNKLSKELVSHERNEKFLQDKIHELKRQFGDEQQRQVERETRLQKISNLEKEKEELLASLKTGQTHKEKLRSSISSVTDQISEANEEIKNLTDSVNNKKNHLLNLKQSSSNQLSRFGSYFPELVKLIEEEYQKGNFIKMPLGPIGHKIKLKDVSTGLAVESCLKTLLFAFCCDNTKDAKVLQNLMHRVIGNDSHPLIITRKFKQRHNTTCNQVSTEKYPSMIDLLQIDEDPIFNVLVDRLSIESISYIAKEDEAFNVMTNIHTVPHNCLQAYTREGTNMYPRKENQYFKSYTSNFKQARYLSRNIQTYIQELQGEINQLTQEILAKNQANVTSKQILNQNKTDIVNVDLKIRDLNKRIGIIESEILDLKNMEEPTSIEISTFEEELESFIGKKVKINEKIKTINESLKQISSDVDDLTQALFSQDEERNVLIDQQQPLQNAVNSFNDRVNNNKRQMAKLEVIAKNWKTSHSKIEDEISKLKNDLETLTVEASNACSKPIRTKRSSCDIKKEIEEIQIFLNEKEKEIGNRNVIMEHYQMKNAKLRETLSKIETIEEYLKEFKASMKTRFIEYHDLKNRITKRACNVFALALETLNFSGTLNVYHENTLVDGVMKNAKTLEIKINPKANNQSKIYNDTRSLSGGERSFSTVAFLLALWKSCNSPFRILDEVDVFMDMVTRSTAIQILIANAKLKSNKQYIFLSPLGLVTFENSIHVHRLPDPIRTNLSPQNQQS